MSDNPIKVLLIEDNRGDARLIQEILSEATWRLFELEFAERLSEGLEALSSTTFDVVLLDLSLPDSSGLDTLAGIQADSPQTPVVVLTGLDDDEIAIEAPFFGKNVQSMLKLGRAQGVAMAAGLSYPLTCTLVLLIPAGPSPAGKAHHRRGDGRHPRGNGNP